MTIRDTIFFAGLGQLCLAAASLAIPRVLRWGEDLAQLRPLTRQVFWTYAAYIWGTNLFFGIVSIVMPDELANHSHLSTALCTFITLYWFARVVIQFTYFDRSEAPAGKLLVVAEWVLVALFVAFTAVYGCAAWYNFGALA
ncbi:MAG: hypothetical protein R3E01_20855 [Pirellulaceae bacterium]|nr:hypothetical protein [Planctomycetales bacterium]